MGIVHIKQAVVDLQTSLRALHTNVSIKSLNFVSEN